MGDSPGHLTAEALLKRYEEGTHNREAKLKRPPPFMGTAAAKSKQQSLLHRHASIGFMQPFGFDTSPTQPAFCASPLHNERINSMKPYTLNVKTVLFLLLVLAATAASACMPYDHWYPIGRQARRPIS